MASRTLAVVLGGGGARGALQVGALRALFEADVRPDILVGTSIGAANAACLALGGCGAAGLAALETAWQDATTANLLPANYLWLTVRALFGRTSRVPEDRMRDFLVAHGLAPTLCFGDLKEGAQLILVAADISGGGAVLYGTSPHQRVLEGVLASSALPPWIRPQGVDGHSLMDGGIVSNLPIEPALSQGATEIIALDLNDPSGLPLTAPGLGPLFARYMNTVQQRETQLELALAAARQVPVLHVHLLPPNPLPVWDFAHSVQLIDVGYELMLQALAGRTPAAEPATRWWERNDWLTRPVSRLYRRRKVA